MVRWHRDTSSYRTDSSTLVCNHRSLQSTEHSARCVLLHSITLHAICILDARRAQSCEQIGSDNRNFTRIATASIILYSLAFCWKSVCCQVSGKGSYPEKLHRHRQTGGNAEPRLATVCAGLKAGLSGAFKDLLWRWAFFILARGCLQGRQLENKGGWTDAKRTKVEGTPAGNGHPRGFHNLAVVVCAEN